MIIQPQVITQGDYGYELPFTLQDGNGDEMDLTSASLVLNVQDAQDPDGELLFSGSMTIDTAVSGTCHYTVAQGNFPSPGKFIAQVVATWSASEVLTWSGITIIVEPSLPKPNN